MAFGTFLTLSVACAGGAITLLSADNQWSQKHTWLMISLCIAAGVFLLLAIASTKWWRTMFRSEGAPALDPGINATATGENAKAAAVGKVEGGMHFGDKYYHTPHAKKPPFVVLDFIDDSQYSHFRIMNSGEQPAYNVQLFSFPVGKFSFSSNIVPCLMPSGDREPVRGLTRIHSEDEPGDQIGWNAVAGLSTDAGLDWNLREFIRDYMLGGAWDGDIFVIPEWQLSPSVQNKTRGHWHRITFRSHEPTIATVMPEGFNPPSLTVSVPPPAPSPPPTTKIGPKNHGLSAQAVIHPRLSGLAESLSNQFLEATEAEMPIQIQPYRDGLILAAKQLQDSDRALSARVVLCDIREVHNGLLKTTRMFHSPKGEFVYDAILLRPVKQGEDDLHYGDEGRWWVVAPNGYLQIFWTDRPAPRPQVPPGNYVADLRIWVGNRNRTFRVPFTIDAERRVTISSERKIAGDGTISEAANAPDALVFDGYAAWRATLALPGPLGFPAFAYVGAKNNQLSSAQPLHNVRARIEYLHNGQPQFIVQNASWWHDPKTQSVPRSWQTRIDLNANESQCVPIFTQPEAAFLSDPSTWPQSARDEQGQTQRLKPGRWKLRITISADGGAAHPW